MSTADIKQRLEDANRTGEDVHFTGDEAIPAQWIRDLARGKDGHPKGLSILGATIQGKLDFEDCTLERPLWLVACTITDGIMLRRAQARLLGFQNCPEIGGIEGASLRVEDSLFLRGSKVQGRVFLLGAKVGGSLECDGATLDGGDGKALDADGLEVSGGLFLRDGFRARGPIRLLGAKVGGNLDLIGATLDGGNGKALVTDNLEVSGGLFLRGGFRAKGCLDLSHAKVGLLIDQAGCWPAKGDLILTGFTYDSLGPESPQTAAQRLDWLGRRRDFGRFDPQPYEQLAKVLKATGHDGEARAVLIAKEKERLIKGEMGWFHRLMWRFYGLISGFGYRRFRPLLWALCIILVGAGVFGWAMSRHLMVPAKERVYMQMAKGDPLPREYPRLNPLVYSADLFLPFVDLGQDNFWMPSTIGKHGRRVTFYMWFHIAAGWVVSALFVAGITGLVKRE